MGSLDTLPHDQRAVLELVLQRGRSYDDLAQLLGIDRAAVRARALAAFDALGPDTGLADESRALITDYLLGQLPARVAEETRDRLASLPYERAWARVLASELEQVAGQPLPEIPDRSTAARTPPAQPVPTVGDGRGVAGGAARARPREGGPRRPPRLSDRPSSRLGGAIMLGVGALIVGALVVVLIAVLGGSSGKRSPSTGSGASTGNSAGTTTSTSTASTSASRAHVVAQSNLNPPPGGSSRAKGVAFVVKAATAYGIIIDASHVAPNNHNAYAAWLSNSSTDAYRLGFVSPAVGKSGQLEVGSGLPTNAGHYKQLLLTVETQSNPTSPGPIVLQGPFSLTSATG
jgi:Sigma-70, region 4